MDKTYFPVDVSSRWLPVQGCCRASHALILFALL